MLRLLPAAPLPQKDHAEDLDETGGGQRPGQCQQRSPERDQQFQQRMRQCRREQKGLKGQPLRDKAVEGGQGRDGDTADQKERRRPGETVNQPPHLLHVPFVGGVQHRPGPHEEQPLEHGMVEGVIQGGNQRQGRQIRQLEGGKDHRQTEPDQDDADILDRVIGQQALQVMLHQGIQHTHHRRDQPQRQHDRPPPPGEYLDEVEGETDHAVDGGLEHDAAHQGRNIGGGHRMRLRQPDMQRNDTGLGGKTEKGQEKGGRGPSRETVWLSAWLQRCSLRSHPVRSAPP